MHVRLDLSVLGCARAVGGARRAAPFAGGLLLTLFQTMPAAGQSVAPPATAIQVESATVSVIEGNTGTTNVTVGFNAIAGQTYTIEGEQIRVRNFAEAGPSNCSSGDFIATPIGRTISIPAQGHVNPDRLTVGMICGDTTREANERFFIRIRCGCTSQSAGTVEVTIVNDDQVENPRQPVPNTQPSPIPPLEGERRPRPQP